MHPPHRTAVLDQFQGGARSTPPAVRVGTLVAVVVAGLVLALVATALTTGVGGLDFRQDHRVTILSPSNGARIPEGGQIEVRWAVEDFTPLAQGSEIDPAAQVDDRTGFFGVFVNTYVPTPGQSVVDWASKRNPTQCPAGFCTSAGALRALGALYTTETSISVPYGVNSFAPDTTQATGITIVLLDARGQRIGDAFWFLPTSDDSARDAA